MKKEEILKKAGIFSNFDKYEVEKVKGGYNIYKISSDILGCVLVGDKLTDINGDGLRDVTNSKITLNKLLQLAPKGFELTISK